MHKCISKNRNVKEKETKHKNKNKMYKSLFRIGNFILYKDHNSYGWLDEEREWV